MNKLPLIVGFGGVNAAGRSSHHHAYRRMVLEHMPMELRNETIVGLAVMMGLLECIEESGIWMKGEQTYTSIEAVVSSVFDEVIQGSLVREIDDSYFDVNRVPKKCKVNISGNESKKFTLSKRHLPKDIPNDWITTELDNKTVEVTILGDMEVMIETTRESDVKSAGQLPTGFKPGNLYNSRYHPRGLQMTVVAAADAVNSLGIPWQEITSEVSPDDIAVYASSCASQMDDNGFGGVLQARLKGDRVSSKQLALGMNSMPADFVNAYICGNVGGTGSMTGACASFLYNLKLGCEDIRQGRKRIVIVGGSEAPITSEIVEGFDSMSALARTSQLEKIDNGPTDPRKSSRPFSDNCGFTIAESAQYVVLMDDELALQLGAQIHGAVADVFVNADGFKKSISSPGVGNYITMSKAVSAAIAIAGEKLVKNSSFVHSHGSSTPQNRVTESEILNKVANVFEIKDWPVTAVKSYLGHSLGPASGDQLAAALGTFKYGILPGIKTIDKVAKDVADDCLSIALEDTNLEGRSDIAFLNSKGFGGNNASAVILSPNLAQTILSKRYTDEQLQAYEQRSVAVAQESNNYDQAFIRGDYKTIYSFGESVVDETKISITRDEISIPGYAKPINLKTNNPYI